MGTGHEAGSSGSGSGKIVMSNYWQDYLFLTNEIEKCLMRQDFQLANELLNQREKLQKMIEDSQDDTFRVSNEGKQMLREVAAKNSGITQILHMLRNRKQKTHAVANAYDRQGMNSLGNRMDNRS